MIVAAMRRGTMVRDLLGLRLPSACGGGQSVKTRLLVLADTLIEALVVTLLISMFIARFVRTPNWVVRFVIVAPIVMLFLRKEAQSDPSKEQS